ncbi:MAG: hypothetical protein ACPGEG_05990 [Salibacteraceae bacterium]
MKLKVVLFFTLTLLASSAFAQKEIEGVKNKKFSITTEDVARKGRFFFYWGYNRSAYTKSDFHIEGEGYDFTVKDMKATDKPSALTFNNYVENISIPQYVYRLGYFINDRVSLSVGIDHLKYYMVPDQTAVVDGYVKPEASAKYAGEWNDEEVYVPWNWVWVHHSDGLNYTSVELEYNLPVWISAKKNFYVDVLGNVGGGLVIPKSYVRVFGEGVDNKFHIAGGGMNLKLGTRFTFWKNFYFEAALKSGYVWMPNILVDGTSTAKANQHFGWTEFFGAVGFSIPLNKNNK